MLYLLWGADYICIYYLDERDKKNLSCSFLIHGTKTATNKHLKRFKTKQKHI
jgi:hypothetical protein